MDADGNRCGGAQGSPDGDFITYYKHCDPGTKPCKGEMMSVLCLAFVMA